jgi:secreted trypsin-like serine protease
MFPSISFLLVSSLCLLISRYTANAQPRIVGGTEVTSTDKYPFFVFLGHCGGSLIHGDIVLTAAHCSHPAASKSVQVGALVRKSTDDGSVYAPIVEEIAHPNFKDGNNEYDFSLLKLGAWIDREVAPINSEFDAPPMNAELIVMGFGSTEEGGDESNVLMETTLAPVNSDDCEKEYYMFAYDKATMICALDDGKDSCSGDSGGPLLYDGVQIGITSWVSSILRQILFVVVFFMEELTIIVFSNQGIGCARLPGVYARVSVAYDWIMEQICIHSEQPPASCGGGDDASQTDATRVRIDVQYDNDPTATSWELVDTTTYTTPVSSVAGEVMEENVLVSSYASLNPGTYEFQINGEGKR